MKEIIGVTQSSNLEEVLEEAKMYLLQGKKIQIEVKYFDGDSKEHDKIEYELYVEFVE